MVSPVTDPNLLARLEQQDFGPVTDPALLARLEEGITKTPHGFEAVSEPSLMDKLGRQAGLTTRAIAGGMAQAAEPFTEPVRYLLNKALPGSPVGNIETATDEVMTSIGVPEPQGALERGVQSAGRFVASAGVGAGGAKTLERGMESALGLSRQVRPEIPSTGQLKKYAKAAYKDADDAGVVVHPGSFKNFATRIKGVAKQAGIDKDIHPKATAAVRRITDAADEGVPIKLEDITILRRVLSGAKGSIEKDERRIAGIITEHMDDYVTRLGANDVIAGNPQAAGAALVSARNLWTRASKSETVQEAIGKAGKRAGQFSGSGFENALRTQFRQIAMNNKRMRRFSEAEKAAIDKIAMGGPIDNAFRTLGKLAPTGIVSAGISGGAGYAMGGPVGAVALPLAGAVARRVATGLTKGNVENLSEMVRRGGPAVKEVPDWLLPWLSGGIFGADTQE